MDQQPGRRPARQGQGRPPRGRQSGTPDDYVVDPPNVVRPFVQQVEEAGGRQPNAGERRYGGGGPDGAPGGGAPSVPGTSLVPSPMPPPRAVARQIPPGDRAPVPYQPPMNDLTTTMPILAVPIEDDGYNAPPGEPGHYHEDGDGRHRGAGSRSRALKAAAVLVGVVAAGVAVAGTFAGGSGKSATPQAAGASSAGAAPAQDAASSDAPSSAAAGPAATPSQSATTSPTPTRSSKSPTPRPSTSSKASATSPAMASRPSSAASTPSAPPPSTPSSTPAPPAFQALHYRDTGPAVSKLQANLIAAGYDWDMYGYTDGTFDRATRRAVEDFQMNHPGTADADGYGVYGAATDAALQSSVKGAASG